VKQANASIKWGFQQWSTLEKFFLKKLLKNKKALQDRSGERKIFLFCHRCRTALALRLPTNA